MIIIIIIIFGIETMKASFKIQIKSTTNFENSMTIRSKTRNIKSDVKST